MKAVIVAVLVSVVLASVVAVLFATVGLWALHDG
jgi:hypothetical protein